MRKRLVLSVLLGAIVVAAFFLARPTPRSADIVPEEVVISPADKDAALKSAPVMSKSGATLNIQEPSVAAKPQAERPLPPAQSASMTAAPATAAVPPSASPQVEEITGPDEEIENVQFMVRGYRDVLGENPVGTNAEITRALMGENARQVKMPLPLGSHLNADGELVDRWGTPYFFHQLSGTEMEIRSAGEDRQMWTGDDLLTR